MHHKDSVRAQHPEALAVEEPLSPSPGPWSQRGCWFVYSGVETDARVLGRGVTEGKAWANAAHRLKRVRRKVKWLVAG
jgi:hypothetical protein